MDFLPLDGIDPFDYLTELQTHAANLARCPQDWMPWNDQETLSRGFDLLDAAA